MRRVRDITGILWVILLFGASVSFKIRQGAEIMWEIDGYCINYEFRRSIISMAIFLLSSHNQPMSV